MVLLQVGCLSQCLRTCDPCWHIFVAVPFVTGDISRAAHFWKRVRHSSHVKIWYRSSLVLLLAFPRCGDPLPTFRSINSNSNSNSNILSKICYSTSGIHWTGLYPKSQKKCKPTGSSHIPLSVMVAAFAAVVSYLHRRIPCPIGWLQEPKEALYGSLRSLPEK